eukprot:Opistho-2@88516
MWAGWRRNPSCVTAVTRSTANTASAVTPTVLSRPTPGVIAPGPILDYNNVFAGVNLKPNVSWSQDVSGYGPNGLFNEGAKAISVGVDADYRNTYTASLSYTDFFGGDYNTLTDRPCTL